MKGFEYAVCVERIDVEILKCFKGHGVAWILIPLGSEHTSPFEAVIPFPMNTDAFVLVRAKHGESSTGFEYSKEFLSSTSFFRGPTHNNATQRRATSGTGYDFDLIVIGADTPLVQCYLLEDGTNGASTLSSTWSNKETFVHEVGFVQKNYTNPVIGDATFACVGVYFKGYDYTTLNQPMDSRIPWATERIVGNATVKVVIIGSPPPPPENPPPVFPPAPPAPPFRPPPSPSYMGITNVEFGKNLSSSWFSVNTWDEQYMNVTFHNDLPHWQLEIEDIQKNDVLAISSDNTVVYEYPLTVQIDLGRMEYVYHNLTLAAEKAEERAAQQVIDDYIVQNSFTRDEEDNDEDEPVIGNPNTYTIKIIPMVIMRPLGPKDNSKPNITMAIEQSGVNAEFEFLLEKPPPAPPPAPPPPSPPAPFPPPAPPPPEPPVPGYVKDGPEECVEDEDHVGPCGYTVFMYDTRMVSWMPGDMQPGILLYVYKDTGNELQNGRVPFQYRVSVDTNSNHHSVQVNIHRPPTTHTHTRE